MKNFRFYLAGVFFIISLLASTYSVNGQATFYGTSSSGEGSGVGTIHTFDFEGKDYTIIHNFKYDEEGLYPNSAVTPVGTSTLYGVTQSGGDSSEGVLFKYDLSTDTYTVLHHFKKSTGAQPFGKLFGPFGNIFYGTTYSGGDNDDGTFFQFDINTNTYTMLHSFEQFFDGAGPRSNMVLAPNGKIYGTTLFGGNSNNRGTIYVFDTTTKKVTNLHKFNGSQGAVPYGPIVVSSEGIVYGTCNQGGSANRGIIYSFNTNNNSYSIVYSASNSLLSAQYIRSGLYLEKDSILYGQSIRGGSNNRGALFSYNIKLNTFNILHSFVDSSGYEPQASITKIDDNTLLGSTFRGGKNGLGSIYTYTLTTNEFTKLVDISQPSGYHPYRSFVKAFGRWFVLFQNGGNGGHGVLSELNTTTSTLNSIFDFGVSENGRSPRYGMTWANNGSLFGITTQGGEYNGGVVYEINPITNTYTKKVDFDAYTIGNPSSKLCEAPNGNFYGISYIWGEDINNGNALYEYNPTNDSLTLKYRFENIFAEAEAPLVLGNNGILYGTANYDPDTGRYIVFSYLPGDTSVTIEAQFNEEKGEDVEEELLMTKEGRIFGLAEDGGNNNRGTLFEFIPSSKNIVVRHTFSQPEGTDPRAKLFQASNGKLYGTTSRGGTNNRGVLFEYDITQDKYTSLVQFSNFGVNSSVYTDLTEGDSGILIGFMDISSTNKRVIFNYDIKADTLIGVDSLSRRIEETLTKVCAPFDGGLTIEKGISLETKTTGDKYQWYNCYDSLPVVGANNRKLLPPTSSRYNARVSKQGCTYTTDCADLVLTSVLELTSKPLKLYPNPANTEINIELPFSANASNSSVELYTVAGKKIADISLGNISVSHLPAGMYFVVATAKGQKYVGKFVKE